MKSQIKKTIIILFAVLFVATLTSAAASAQPCHGPKPHCQPGQHMVCDHGHWKCVGHPTGFCRGPMPHCHPGQHPFCDHGHWKCV